MQLRLWGLEVLVGGQTEAEGLPPPPPLRRVGGKEVTATPTDDLLLIGWTTTDLAEGHICLRSHP